MFVESGVAFLFRVGLQGQVSCDVSRSTWQIEAMDGSIDCPSSHDSFNIFTVAIQVACPVIRHSDVLNASRGKPLWFPLLHTVLVVARNTYHSLPRSKHPLVPASKTFRLCCSTCSDSSCSMCKVHKHASPQTSICHSKFHKHAVIIGVEILSLGCQAPKFDQMEITQQVF